MTETTDELICRYQHPAEWDSPQPRSAPCEACGDLAVYLTMNVADLREGVIRRSAMTPEQLMDALRLNPEPVLRLVGGR